STGPIPLRRGIVTAPFIVIRGMLKGLLAIISIGFFVQSSDAQRQMEQLDRGVVAVPAESRKAVISWRLLASDEPDVALNVYLNQGMDWAQKLNDRAVGLGTDYM